MDTGGSLDPRIRALAADQQFRPEALIEVLHRLQALDGALPKESLRQVAQALGLPLSRVVGVASFYHLFRLEPPRPHRCAICLGSACFVLGAPSLAALLEVRLGQRLERASGSANGAPRAPGPARLPQATRAAVGPGVQAPGGRSRRRAGTDKPRRRLPGRVSLRPALPNQELLGRKTDSPSSQGSPNPGPQARNRAIPNRALPNRQTRNRQTPNRGIPNRESLSQGDPPALTWSLEPVSCLGACGQAPVLVVDGVLALRLPVDSAPALQARLDRLGLPRAAEPWAPGAG